MFLFIETVFAVAYLTYIIVNEDFTGPFGMLTDFRAWAMQHYANRFIRQIALIIECYWCSAFWVGLPFNVLAYVAFEYDWLTFPIWHLAVSFAVPATLHVVDRINRE